MRIQETDRVLKESRIARHAAGQNHENGGMMSKMWKAVSALPARVTSLWKH